MFLIDSNIQYSYNELFLNLKNSKTYYYVFHTKSLFHFFTNFLTAIINDKPLIIIDFDSNFEELDKSIRKKINVPQIILNNKTPNENSLAEQILNSKSEITIFTSGTTGQPKKLTHNISNLMRTVRIGEKYKNNVWALAFNPTHMAGLQVFFQAISNHNKIVNIFNYNKNEITKILNLYQVTHISATPTFYRLLLPNEKSFPSVQRITFGGEKFDNKLFNGISELFPNAKLNNIYASTEAATLLTSNGEYFTIPEHLAKLIQIKDNELLIHKSLLGNSDSLKIDNEFYYSGDIIEWICENKKLFKFKSRKNELINIGGSKINPAEVEDLLNSIHGVKQSLVYSKPNSVIGNILIADIQLDMNTKLTELDIKQFLAGKIPDYKIPRKIRFVENFSITRTGKIQRI